MGSELSFEEKKIIDVINNFDLSVRLKNVLRNSDFPYSTVGELINAVNLESDILRVQNAGKKTAREVIAFVDLLRNYDFVSEKKSAEISIENNIFISMISVLDTFEFPFSILSSDIHISVRLDNILSTINSEQDREYRTLGDCVREPNKFYAYVLKFRNSGRTSVNELKKVLNESYKRIFESMSISNSLINYFFDKFDQPFPSPISVPNGWEEQKEKIQMYLINSSDTEKPSRIPTGAIPDEISEDFIINQIKEVVDERTFSILSQRFGLIINRTLTLEEIASSYSITRERIRQIEAKGINTLSKRKRVLFESHMQSRVDYLKKIIWESISFLRETDVHKKFQDFSGLDRLSISVLYKKEALFLEKTSSLIENYWVPKDLDDTSLSLIKSQIINDSRIQSIKNSIRRLLVSLPWPIKVEDLCMQIPIFRAEDIIACLEEHFCAQIVGNVITKASGCLTVNERLTIILKNEQKALSIEELANIHFFMFGESISKGSIINTLGSSNLALIVSRGYYNLYENLTFSIDDLKKIREESFDYLTQKQQFISAKVICTELFSNKGMNDNDFNAYMLYGILQDDDLFLCKRGMMVGLKTFIGISFTGLRETIFNLVDEHGPIRPAEIQRALLESRDIFTSTISAMLDNSDEYIKIGKGNYDRIDKAIGGIINLKNLKISLELMLIDGHINMNSLQNKLSILNINLPTRVILSLLQKWGGFHFESRNIYLEEPSYEVFTYNRLFQKAKNIHINPKLLREYLVGNLPKELLYIIPLDIRLIATQTINDNSGDITPIILSGFKVNIGINSNGK